jgi:hypothetical protein
VAWLVCGAFALGALAAIVAGRRMILRDRRAFASGGPFDGREASGPVRGGHRS